MNQIIQNKSMVFIYLRKELYEAYGVRVIVDEMMNIFPYAKIIFSLNNIPLDSIVIPYGVLESYALIKNGKFRLKLSLLTDAFSLGQISDIKSFIGFKDVHFRYIFACLLRFFKHLFYEYKILKNFDYIMLVSWGDKEYYKRIPLTRKYVNKIVVVPNGVYLPSIYNYEKRTKRIFRIGCLSAWGGIQVFYYLQLFLKKIWSNIPDNYPCELIVAGRGLTPKMCEYISKFPKTKIIGEVNSLQEFYGTIDASLVNMKKKCGIINRVLDGFAYKVPVICPKENLLAFKGLPDCCYVYSNVTEFIEAMNSIRREPERAIEKTTLAYNYVRDNHNWTTNYKLIKEILANEKKN